MKPYAIINLKTLKAATFSDKDNMRDAIATLTGRGIKCLALKYDPLLGCYMALECETSLDDKPDNGLFNSMFGSYHPFPDVKYGGQP